MMSNAEAICLACRAGDCDPHCAECGGPVEPDTSAAETYWPLCCTPCFEADAQRRAIVCGDLEHLSDERRELSAGCVDCANPFDDTDSGWPAGRVPDGFLCPRCCVQRWPDSTSIEQLTAARNQMLRIEAALGDPDPDDEIAVIYPSMIEGHDPRTDLVTRREFLARMDGTDAARGLTTTGRGTRTVALMDADDSLLRWLTTRPAGGA